MRVAVCNVCTWARAGEWGDENIRGRDVDSNRVCGRRSSCGLSSSSFAGRRRAREKDADDDRRVTVYIYMFVMYVYMCASPLGSFVCGQFVPCRVILLAHWRRMIA